MLAYLLAQLFLAVLAKSGQVGKALVDVSAGTDEGNFRPYNHAISVHQVVDVFCLGVVRQAHGVHSHLCHQGDVLLVVPRTEGVAHFTPVLVAAHAPKLQVLAVEEKAFLRVYPEGTQAQGLLDGIRLLPVYP